MTLKFPALGYLPCLAVTAAMSVAVAAENLPATAPAVDLSLEYLLRKEVTSVSRRSERLGDAAAAVYVISSQQILRSGARSVPEALRLAPGVDAVRLSANRWSVSIRGGNDRFSNKLLFLVDGRNAYNPNFSGVFWETVLPPLADIERIEVVRGPGAVAWGTNAVNGVINIISKSATASHGLRAQAGGGTREGAFASLRYGGEVADSKLHYRGYVRGQEGHAFETAGRDDAFDDFDNNSAGLRLDGYLDDGAQWDVSADYFEVESESEPLLPAPPPIFIAPVRDQQKLEGISLRGRYLQELAAGAELEVQLAYAHTDLEFPALGRDQRDTYDAEAQYRPQALGRHSLNLGAGLRVSTDRIDEGLQQQVRDQYDSLTVASLFAEDNISLTRATTLTLGLRLDDHEYSGVEYQPTVRLLWNISDSQSLWGSVSRAARTPSRGERSFNYTLAFLAPGVPVVLQGTREFDSEYLLATEVGYRSQITPRVFADVTAFHHSYDDLRSFEFAALPTISLRNDGELDIYGAELTTSWRPLANVSLTGNYAYTDTGSEKNQALEAALVPEHIASFNLGWDISPAVITNLTAYYVSERNEDRVGDLPRIDDFISLNLALSWRATPNIQLRVVGQDLLERSHVEAVATVPARRPVEVPRGVYADITLTF